MFGRCGKCGGAEIGPDGRCTLCGFRAGLANRLMARMYVITAALASSVLIYGVLACFLTQAGGLEARPEGLPAGVIYAFIAASVVAIAIGLVVARPGSGPSQPARLFPRIITAAALCEVPAVLGFVAAVLTGGLQWMAVLLATSLVGFLGIGMEMPVYAQRVTEYVASLMDDEGLEA